MDRVPAPPAPRRLDTLLGALFVVALCIPAIVWAGDREREGLSIANERRLPASFPDPSTDLAQLENWPDAFESWFDDHFGLRSRLIRRHNLLELFAFKTSPIDEMMLGRDQWMFIGGRDYIDGYRGVRPFSLESLASWGEGLQRKQDWCDRRGIRFLFVIAPSKSSIYPEMMPPWIDVVSERRRYDQLIDHLRDATTVRTIDLRPPLLAAKERSEVPLYFPLGSHWNDLGAFTATREIVSVVAEWFPKVGVAALGDYEIQLRDDGGDDSWASRLYLEDVFSQPWARLVRRKPPLFDAVRLGSDEAQVLTYSTKREDLPRAVLLRDSFGTAIAPLLAPHFSHLRCYWERSMKNDDLPGTVEAERPDVLIELMVERLIGRVDFHPLIFEEP